MDPKVVEDALLRNEFQVSGTIFTSHRCCILCVHEIGERQRSVKDDDEVEFVAKSISLACLDAKSRACSLQEVSVLRGLAKHPNLIAYRESFIEESIAILVIVMSYAEDGDLRVPVKDAMELQRRIPEPVVVHWMRQIILGIQHLHNQAVVHRDLKSSNIFLSHKKSRVRIGDFGISRVLESTAFASSCVGTPAYMSPELMRNERYTFHVDMWAVGCICFELCTLRLPFVANSLLGLVYEVVNSEPNWDLWKGFSKELEDVSRRLVQKDATKRPLAEDLLTLEVFKQDLGPPELWPLVELDAEPPQAGAAGASSKVPHVPLSQITTAESGAINAAQSSGSPEQRMTWSRTPRPLWESPEGGARGATSTGGSSSNTVIRAQQDPENQDSDAFADAMTTARLEHREFTRTGFNTFLETHLHLTQTSVHSDPNLAGEDRHGGYKPPQRDSPERGTPQSRRSAQSTGTVRSAIPADDQDDVLTTLV